MKTIAYIVYGVSQVLYKLFGVNTPIRKAWLAKKAYELQKRLDYEHYVRDNVNKRVGEFYTTKKAMKVAETNDWL